MDIGSSISLVVGIANLLLGLFVFGKRSESQKGIKNSFTLLAISVTVWSACIYFFRTLDSLFLLSLCADITYVSALAITFFFSYFCLFFIGKEKIKFWINVVLPGLFLIICLLIVGSNLIIGRVVIKDGVRGLAFGKLYQVYGFAIAFFFAFGLYHLVFSYKESSKEKKVQIKYVLVGTIISATLAFITNFLLFGRGAFQYNWLGPSSTLVLVVCIAYAISKHHLFNIKVIATEVLVALVAFVIFIDFLLSEGLLDKLLRGFILVVFLFLGWSLIKSVLQEIERRKKIERMAADLQQAYDELKQLDEAKSEFIAMASHQLRTPLTVIKGLSDMILEGTYGEPPKKIKETVKDIFDSNERLVRIVNDLLDISKADLGKLELEKEELDFCEIIESVVEELKSQAEEKGLKIRWTKPKDIKKIKADRIKIRQVIFNVVDNAIKYTQEGEINIKLTDENGKLLLAIKDTGEGMTEEEQEKIFESFTRGRAGIDRWVQGTGLGLYLAKRYIELHEGRIWADSDGKGKGSTFFIEIPKDEKDENGKK